MPEFQKFPSIPRLYRDCVIPEKIDGTNSCVVIWSEDQLADAGDNIDYIPGSELVCTSEGTVYWVGAQSRNKFVTPGKSTDNHGFAAWVYDNKELLVQTLGEGRHYGEWWGSGIQRGYGLKNGVKFFSLFNTGRWSRPEIADAVKAGTAPEALDVVPVLYSGPYSDSAVNNVAYQLEVNGSVAAPGFMNPEGIIIYHTASRVSFKYTLDGDGHKGGF